MVNRIPWSMLECEGLIRVRENDPGTMADILVYVKMRCEFVKLLGSECAEEILSLHYSEIVEDVKKHLEEKLKKCVLHWEIRLFHPAPTHRDVNLGREEAYLGIKVVLHAPADGVLLREAFEDIYSACKALAQELSEAVA